jgi:hypothetical protein
MGKMTSKTLWVACFAVAAAGCGGLDGPGTVGELGNGLFTYECELPSGDAVCNNLFPDPVNRQMVNSQLGTDGDLPEGIAVNGRFDLHYFGDVTTDGLDRLTIVVEPAASEHVDDRGGFVIREPGLYAFLARDRAERTVADFTYLDAFEASDLKVWHNEQVITELTLDFGTEVQIAVVPLALIQGEEIFLAGALAYEWTSSDENVAIVDPANSIGEPQTGVELNDDEVRVSAVGEGTATITIQVGGVLEELTVTVNPEVLP